MKVNGTYEEGVMDTLKFLKDNDKIDFDMPQEEFIKLLSELSGRRIEDGS